ncbi:MAG: methylated-DNA--[protein]-cysteine S-methyltransferase [Candidatus Vogelbacteria bacterium]|nr:methylated-DNA--[protein]-cysteine S-methyltransferase [Candidatus Vogelbacteria bacterium]
MSNDDLVFETVRLVPRGQVTTYGAIAKLTGFSPRTVGQILHRNKRPREISCHRVVRSDGSLATGYAFGGPAAQKKKLLAEGIIFKHDRVQSEKFCFPRPNRALQQYFMLLRQFGRPAVWPWSGGPAHTSEEIVIGAILTQRISWRNVEMALANLRAARANNLETLRRLGKRQAKTLENLIRPSGFYRQKTERLLTLAQLVARTGGWQKWRQLAIVPLRRALLDLKGIGPETADTILLYALGRPVFVIDEYTRRFVRHYRLTRAGSYDALQKFFSGRLPPDLQLYQSYHALIVLWGKKAV